MKTTLEIIHMYENCPCLHIKFKLTYKEDDKIGQKYIV